MLRLMVASLILAACAASNASSDQVLYAVAAPEVDYRLILRDNPPERRFDIEFVSISPRELCIDRQRWPTDQGVMNFAHEDIFVVAANGQRYELQDDQDAACTGDCEVRVQSHERKQAFLSYAGFSTEAFSQVGERTLTFPFLAVFCDPVNAQ
jgi:hypothetical protein